MSKNPSMISNQSKAEQKNKKKEGEDKVRTSIRIPTTSHDDINQTTSSSSSANVTYSEHKLKYKLVRVAVDAVDFWLVESGAALQLWVKLVLNLWEFVCKEVFLAVSCSTGQLQSSWQAGELGTFVHHLQHVFAAARLASPQVQPQQVSLYFLAIIIECLTGSVH